MKGIKLCPAIEEVFADEPEQNRKHFKPLAAIDLSLIDKSWTGQVFVVYFNDDPYCEESVPYLNDFCDGDKVTFDIIDGKYRFKADFNYFTTTEDWKKWLEVGDKSYTEFLEKLKTDEMDPADYVIGLNQEPEWIQADETPLNSEGKKMKFICQMDSGDIVNDYCGETIYLFYDPVDQIAVQVHQID